MKKQNIQSVNLNKPGFTLVELLVVIAIMAVLAGVGGNSFVAAGQKLKVQKAANALLVTAQYARIAAIEKQRMYKLVLDTANNEFYLLTTVVYDDTGEIFEEVVNIPGYRPVKLDSGIVFEGIDILLNEYYATEDSSIIVFTADGTSQPALVQIGDGKTHLTLSVNQVTGNSKLYPMEMQDVPVDTYDLDANY